METMQKLAAETLPDGFSYEWTTLAYQQLRAGNTAVYSFVLFFFQAEDGIRDPLVTGVQTCALPISSPSASGSRATSRCLIGIDVSATIESSCSQSRSCVSATGPASELSMGSTPTPHRSEERRVGKECRSRWSP